jgi:hypothetical protein
MAAARLTAQNGCQMCQILVGCVDSFTKCNCNDLMMYLQYRCHPELSLLEVWLAKKEEGIHVPSMNELQLAPMNTLHAKAFHPADLFPNAFLMFKCRYFVPRAYFSTKLNQASKDPMWL